MPAASVQHASVSRSEQGQSAQGADACLRDAAAAREADHGALYIVQSGDTLAGIAAAHGLSVLDLLEANPGVGGNLACLRPANARVKAATTAAVAWNPFLQRFLGSLRWCWHLHGCFRRRRGGERQRALLDTAQAQLDAAGRGLVEDIVRRASAAREDAR